MEATTAVIWLTLISMSQPTGDNVTEAGFDYTVSASQGKSPSSSSSSASSPPTTTTTTTITTTAAAAANTNITSSSSYSSSYYISPTMSMVIYVATCTIAVVGFLSNGYVLLAMVFSKKSRASNVNVFITHQTILDLTACIFLFFGLVLKPTGMSDSLALFVCWILRSKAMSITVGNASICGLVIITVERYVKIVHPVAYRNHYRPWMTRLGIVIPWIFGICMGLIPIWATAKVVRGRCILGRVGSTPGLQLTWNIAKFLLQYAGPLAVFVFGYWKILAAIRRQRKQVGHHQPQGTFNAATAAEATNKRIEMNIIKTMVLVSVSFAVCFFCMRVYTILNAIRAVPFIGELYPLFSVFSYASRCLNPFIYATQYEVVRRWWKVMICQVIRRQNVEEVSMTPSSAPPVSEKQQTRKIHVATKNL